MRVLSIGLGIFIFTCSVLAGTFLETFDDRDLEGWQEIWADKEPAFWEVVNDELRAVSCEGYIH